MGRPPKYRAPADLTSAPADDEAPELEADVAPFEPEELVADALRSRAPLTPATVQAMNETWRTLVLQDDDTSKREARDIVARFRRATHPELHPGCQRVTVDVPVLRNASGKGMEFVRINERAYVGTVEVWECEARTILGLVHHHRLVEAARLSDTGGGNIDLDSPLAERVRAIQRA